MGVAYNHDSFSEWKPRHNRIDDIYGGMYQIDEKTTVSDPRDHLLPEHFQIINVYNYLNFPKTLPDTGAACQQGAWIMEALSIIRGEINKLEKEERDRKSKRK